jgi:1-acyl-sn-glycerol-3-phosphate acyltransferase
MIPTNRKRWFEHFFAWHVTRRFAKRFSAVRVRGLEHMQRERDRKPILLVSNHTSWWDPLLMFHLSFRGMDKLEGHAMMDANNLRALPLLGWIGAFGVELGNKEDGELAVQYGAAQLCRPRKLVGIYPQGRERPITERPLRFKPGAARMALLAPVEPAIVPLALRYEHGRHEKPELLVNIGPSISREGDVASLTERMERAVTELLDEIQRAVHAGSHREWPVYIDGGAGPSLGERVLAGNAPRVHR